MSDTNSADEALQDYLAHIEALRQKIHRAEYQIASAKQELTDLYLDIKNDGFDLKAVKRAAKLRELAALAGLDIGEGQ